VGSILEIVPVENELGFSHAELSLRFTKENFKSVLEFLRKEFQIP